MNADADTTIAALRQAVAEFVDARDWRPFHGPKNLSMSIAIETAELMERFQWLTTEEAQAAVAHPDERAAVADELADVIIYCLSLPVLDGQSREQCHGPGRQFGSSRKT